MERQAKGLAIHGLGENSAVTKGKVTERYVWRPEQSVSFGGNSQGLALVADCLLSQQVQRPDYLLDMELMPGWPTQPLPSDASRT